jgi:GT2 family glycosyltransferase
MNTQPRISVIIPAYNAGKTIYDCLRSLENQSAAENYEVIVVDDGSTDNTKSIIKNFRNVRLIEQQHMGPAAARNLGAKNSTGEIFMFTDADCVLNKDWISRMAEPFKNSEISGAQGSYKTEQKSAVARFAQLEIEERYDRMKSRKSIDFIGSYSAAYRKDVFLKVGGFDESFPMASGEDPELSFKLAESGHKMVFVPEAIVYHKHPESLEKYLKQKFWRAYWRIPLYKKHPQKIKSESYTPQLLKIQIALLCLLIGSILVSIFMPIGTISFIIFLVLIASTLPLSWKNFKKDKLIGIISPAIIILRTISFGMGIVYGFARQSI